MHIWPSTSIRDSFKVAYLSKLEWNLQRMKTEKQQQRQSSANQKLLDGNNGEDNAEVSQTPKSANTGGVIALGHDLLMLLSCCFCCFCCGACLQEK